MCRFIVLDSYKEKGKWYVVLYDKTRNFLFVESLRRFRLKYSFYQKHGIQKGGE